MSYFQTFEPPQTHWKTLRRRNAWFKSLHQRSPIVLQSKISWVLSYCILNIWVSDFVSLSIILCSLPINIQHTWTIKPTLASGYFWSSSGLSISHAIIGFPLSRRLPGGAWGGGGLAKVHRPQLEKLLSYPGKNPCQVKGLPNISKLSQLLYHDITPVNEDLFLIH